MKFLGNSRLFCGSTLALGVGLGLLVPTAFTLRSALANDDDDNSAEQAPEAQATRTRPKQAVSNLTQPELQKKRQKILTAVATDENVLINVTGREMPASPDIINLGKRSTKALARCVADNVDDNLRAMCANMLGRLGDAAALPALQGALEAWAPEVRRAAIDALRAIPSSSSDEALIKLTQRADELPDNIDAAYRTLGMSGSPKAIAALRTAFRDGLAAEKHVGAKEDDEDSSKNAHADAAFDGLWRARHRVARAALISDVGRALKSTNTSLQAKGTKAAAELRAPDLVSLLIPMMNHSDMHVRNRAVYALGKIGDKAATAALVAQIPKVREARMLNNIAFALERLDPAAFFTVARQLAEHKQASIRMNTAFVLGDVRRTEGVPLLSKALSDKNDMVRVSAVHALGNIDSPQIEKLLTPFVANTNTSLSHEAIYGIFTASGKKKTDLIYSTLYSSENAETKFEAAMVLADAGDARVTPDVLACLENSRCSLTQVQGFLTQSKVPEVPGRMMLEWTTGRRELTPLVIALKPAGAIPLASSTISKGLAHHDTRTLAAATDLAGALRDKSATTEVTRVAAHDLSMLRLHGLLALAELGDSSADAKLFAELDNLSESRLYHAAEILGALEAADVRARLLPYLAQREKSGDPRMALACARVHLAWDPDAAIFRFLDGLASESAQERKLAASYLEADLRERTTWLLRRALARESRADVRDTLRVLVDARPQAGN